MDKDGYTIANLYLEPGNPKTANRKRDQLSVRVNRIVLATFKPIPGWQNLFCNHIDSIRSNNYIENLEWVTAKENTQHGFAFGYQGFNCTEQPKAAISTLNEKEVLKVVELLNTTDLKYKEIADMFNVRLAIIREIANGRHYTNLTNGLLNEDAVRLSTTYTNGEIREIFDFFESIKDTMNDKTIYEKLSNVLNDCYWSTSLCNKYSYEYVRKTMTKILRRDFSDPKLINLSKKYTYHYDY